MKKLIAMLAAVTMLLSMAACADSTDPVETETQQPTPIATIETIDAPDPNEEIAGGWLTNTEFGEFTVPEEVGEVFEQAVGSLDGVAYEPIAYLGSQVVAGTNYAFLCKATVVVPDAVPSLAVVVVYKDLEGNADVLRVSDVDVSAATANMAPAEAGTVGGWWHDDAIGVGLDEDVQSAFDTALDGYTGVGYQPLALIGTQVVGGINYAILCTATPATAEPSTSLSVLTIFASADGTTQITASSPFPIPAE